MSISDWSSDVCSSDLKDLVICLFSGGASALIADCPEGITLKELQETSGLLLRSGADIAEIYTVRKHLSTLKGGQLARRAEPARVMALLISDVVGDDPGTIASGPVTADARTFEDAWQVIESSEKGSVRKGGC